MKIIRVDGKAFLEIGSAQIALKDYKISSSMQDGTELEVVISINDGVMEFETQAN